MLKHSPPFLSGGRLRKTQQEDPLLVKSGIRRTHGKYRTMKKRKIVLGEKTETMLRWKKGTGTKKKGKQKRAGRAEVKKTHGG